MMPSATHQQITYWICCRCKANPRHLQACC